MARKNTKKNGSGKRTLIAPNDDKRYVKRDSKDVLRKATIRLGRLRKVKPGYGDQGDHRRRSRPPNKPL